MKPKSQPPLSPGDAADLMPPTAPPVVPPPISKSTEADFEQTIDYVRAPTVGKPKVESLLPPGAEAEAAPPPVPAAKPSFAPQNAASPVVAAPISVSVRKLSPEVKAQRRFLKNAIVFGFFVVVLLVVCLLLAR